MADIKSAREIAQEKIDGLGEVTEEERLRWKYLPEGEKLAAKYLDGKCGLEDEIKGHKKEAQTYIKKGAEKVLLANIGLPKDEKIKDRNKKALDALVLIKKDKEAVKAVLENVEYIFNHYNEQGEQQRTQAYQSLKSDFAARLKQAVQQKMGTAEGLDINVETLPQFNEEWQGTLAQLDTQYINLLDESKQQLSQIE